MLNFIITLLLLINYINCILIDQSKPTFLYFYKDNCIHCSNFNFNYNKLNELYENTSLQLLKLNNKQHPYLITEYNIVEYPTLLLIHDFEIKKFKKFRNLDNLIDFINVETGILPIQPNSKILKLNENNNILNNLNIDILILFHSNYLNEYEEYISNYEKISENFSNEVQFTIVDISLSENSDLIRNFKISNYPTLIYLKSGRLDNSVYYKLDIKEVEQLIKGEDNNYEVVDLKEIKEIREIHEDDEDDDDDDFHFYKEL
ncbi:hypothetical protein CANARDRAFT_7481 [[Candida] arabinofermentans NRRL YB-2248]|uniref:Thioredoxin domain-containing protein n=1 Tax=[Candida] arabinofermentans NRRL YB-2248 TaxID=983967 RepID=A0A1E4T0Y1_9ASCO|nr:hypothetical protein CANARDRAFT_7481 [[Candida] arabinofermentans NRRL YB-2248]